MRDPSTTHGTVITHFCVARRQGVNLGGNILKTIFGTTTVSDIHELHGVLDLQNRNSDIVYSLANQLTYVKK